MSASFLRNGTVKDTVLQEFYQAGTHDRGKVYTEPDGSKWIKVFHHNCPAGDGNLFVNNPTTFASSEGMYMNPNAWFSMYACNLVSRWELMVKQCATVGGAVSKYRWVQSKNPMTAAYADVAASAVTKNTSSGYSTHSSYGGLYKFGTSAYLVANNGNNGNWWGAVGAWTRHDGGIPAYAGVVVKTGFFDVYLRVDNTSLGYAPAGILKSGAVFGADLVEF